MSKSITAEEIPALLRSRNIRKENISPVVTLAISEESIVRVRSGACSLAIEAIPQELGCAIERDDSK